MKDENIANYVDDDTPYAISNENNIKLLGITFDNSLSFDDHAFSLCKKATQKLHALSRISFYEF